MKRGIKVGLTLFFIIFTFQMLVTSKTLFSQDIIPEKPDIFLPSVVLEVEDISVKDIVAPLPEEKLILTPDVNFPLPGKEDLEIDESAISIEPIPSGVETTINI